jgi:hypothetical protein
MLEIQLERSSGKSLRIADRKQIDQLFTWSDEDGHSAYILVDPRFGHNGQIQFRVIGNRHHLHDGKWDFPAEFLAMLVEAVFILDGMQYHFAGLKLDLEFGYYEDVDPAAIFIFRAWPK